MAEAAARLCPWPGPLSVKLINRSENATCKVEAEDGQCLAMRLYRDGQGMDTAKQRLFARTVALIAMRLSQYGRSDDRFGLIHCDPADECL